MTPEMVARARALTPACAKCVHLNNAGAALMPEAVLQAQIDHLRLEAELGGYEAAAAASEKVERPRHALALLLNASADDMVLCDSATSAWRTGIEALDLGAGDEILISRTVYASNFMTLRRLVERRGVRLRVVDSEPTGELSIAALKETLGPRTRLIAMAHMPTNSGLINPVGEVGAIAQAAGVPFLLDACQTVGQLEIDVREVGCDLLSGTGRKFLRGPRGTGFLYINPELAPRLRPPAVDLYAARWSEPDEFCFFEGARRFEQFEFNHAARIGLGVAVDHALSWGLPQIEARVLSLAQDLRHALAGVAGVTVRDPGVIRGGIVTFTVEGHDAAAVLRAAAARRVHLGVSPDWGTLLDMRARGLSSVVRASVHYYNTHTELEELLKVVRLLLRGGMCA